MKVKRKLSRRELMGVWLGSAISSGAGCGAPPEPEEKAEPVGAERASLMILSLSARIAESFSDKEKASLTIDELIALANTHGYEALCMRASQVGVHSPPRLAPMISRKIHEAGLRASMVTGDFAVPRNDGHGPDGLRNITPYLDLADTLRADLIRVCMKKDEDIEWARKAADEARERGIRLAHQAHCASLFETVEGALRVLKAIDRDNFGLIYEPANWMIAGEDYGKAAIEKVHAYIFNVYVQNHRLNPEAETKVTTWKLGPVGVDHIGIWEPGGVDFEEILEILGAIGYDGFVTVHQAFAGVMSVEQAVDKSARYLKRFTR